MKKQGKKLVLAKETIQNLELSQLREAAGGIVSRANCPTIANTAC